MKRRAIDRSIFEATAQLDPPVLRSLDAIYLACAIDLAKDLESVVTYGSRLREAAEANRLIVKAPGVSIQLLSG